MPCQEPYKMHMFNDIKRYQIQKTPEKMNLNKKSMVGENVFYNATIVEFEKKG